jgi:hypothetical protein
MLVLAQARGIENTSGKTAAEFELAAFFGARGSRTYAADRTKTRTYRNAYLIAKDETTIALMASRLDQAGHQAHPLVRRDRWPALHPHRDQGG